MDSDMEMFWLDKLMLQAESEPDFGEAIKRAAAILERAFRLYFVRDGEYSPEKAMRMFRQYRRRPEVRTYRVRYPHFLDPRWMRQNYGKSHSVVVKENSVGGKFVEVEKERINLIEPRDLEVGDLLILRREKATRPEDVKRLDEWRNNYQCIDRLIDKARKFRTRYDAQERNQPLNKLPFKWHPAIKDVLSGLSEHSAGNGRNRATVQHIRLEEDYADSYLQRREGDFLCTAASGTNGKNWSNQKPEYWYDGNNVRYPAPITCKSCLKRAKAVIDRHTAISANPQNNRQ